MEALQKYVTSFIDGRVRLRHPSLKTSETAEMVAGMMRSVDGVTDVQVKPVTGSLLLYYDTQVLSRSDLWDMARQGAAWLGEETAEKSACHAGGTGGCLLNGKVTRWVDRILLLSLLCTLAGTAVGSRAMHRVAGAVFAAGALQHIAAHRRALW